MGRRLVAAVPPQQPLQASAMLPSYEEEVVVGQAQGYWVRGCLRAFLSPGSEGESTKPEPGAAC